MKKLIGTVVMCAMSIGVNANDANYGRMINVGDDIWSYEPVRERMKDVARCSQSGKYPTVTRTATGIVVADELIISCRPEPNISYDIYVMPPLNSLSEVMHEINTCSYYGGEVTIKSNEDGWLSPLLFQVGCSVEIR